MFKSYSATIMFLIIWYIWYCQGYLLKVNSVVSYSGYRMCCMQILSLFLSGHPVCPILLQLLQIIPYIRLAVSQMKFDFKINGWCQFIFYNIIATKVTFIRILLFWKLVYLLKSLKNMIIFLNLIVACYKQLICAQRMFWLKFSEARQK